MTPSDIERMAREAGGAPVDYDDPQCSIGEMAFGPDELARFAALVRAQALEDAARVAEEIGDKYQETESRKWPELRSDAETGANRCAAAIRALGETK